MKKLSMLLVAVLALAMMMGFVGCKQEDDVPSGPAAVTWAFGEADNGMELTAYGDKTWKLVGKSEAQTLELAKGTYTGDATKDGTLKCKITHRANDDTGALEEVSPVEFDCTISGNTLTESGLLSLGTTTFTKK